MIILPLCPCVTSTFTTMHLLLLIVDFFTVQLKDDNFLAVSIFLITANIITNLTSCMWLAEIGCSLNGPGGLISPINSSMSGLTSSHSSIVCDGLLGQTIYFRNVIVTDLHPTAYRLPACLLNALSMLRTLSPIKPLPRFKPVTHDTNSPSLSWVSIFTHYTSLLAIKRQSVGSC